METESPKATLMAAWRPTDSFVRNSQENYAISTKEEIRPCGCSIKLDLDDVVYPALEKEARHGIDGFSDRRDACVFLGGLARHERIVSSLDEILVSPGQASNRIARFRPQSITELYTTSKKYFLDRNGTKEEFLKAVVAKNELLSSAAAAIGKTEEEYGLVYGKGHSIGAGGDLFVFDLFTYDQSKSVYTVSNHDTIVTADSLLKHFAPVSVFAALNNALNDLFLMGVTERLQLFPVYDGEDEEVRHIQRALKEYSRHFQDRGATITVHDQGPLQRGLKIVGASVAGEARHEPPHFSGMLPGQEILLTRRLGDLSFLAMYRSAYFEEGNSEEDAETRRQILAQLATPNYLVAEIIKRYFPVRGCKADPEKHITFATDVSGPGLSVLEEGANASGVSLRIRDLAFVSEKSTQFYRKNHTSSTNGPIAIAASPKLIAQIKEELIRAGVGEAWIVGEVLDRCDKPTVYLSARLRDRYKGMSPRTDLFNPEVHFGDENDPIKIRMPIFRRMQFVD